DTSRRAEGRASCLGFALADVGLPELGLLRWGRHPPVPLRWSLPEHPVGECRKCAAVVPKIEPPSAPHGVVCRHLAVNVEAPPGVTHMERQAAGAREPPWLAPPQVTGVRDCRDV